MHNPNLCIKAKEKEKNLAQFFTKKLKIYIFMILTWGNHSYYHNYLFVFSIFQHAGMSHN